ncbi:serine hydrolase domain-containing protein [Nocardioides albertanoniae]|uniref:serine hydrolase domain-containing protein n=1 Tax=Nocardioides albertanoniae TaxID=1175486 RepID=UPI001FE4BF79|nr:serine hydrolase domain-containing protein [Nocardioides albertanoniae]
MRARLGLVAALAAVLASSTAMVPSAAYAGEDRDALQRRLDDVVPAGAIGALAEVRTDRGVWRGTSGVAEIGTSREVPVRGSFRAGSVMKSFLATVVLQLVGEGRLRLDDSIERWLPGVVPGGDRITLRQLLAHTSGLYDVVRTLPLPPDPRFVENRWHTWSATDLIERGLAQPPTHAPGAAFSYTSTGYLLLGQVVEEVTGATYAAEIERRIIGPLHLRHTMLPGTSPWIPRPHPHGYAQVEGAAELVDVTEMNPSLFGAAGEIVSSAGDLNRFFAALLGGRLLPARLLAEMKTPGIPGETYGLGLRWEDTSCGVPVYGHDGDAVAYQTWSFVTADGRRQATLAVTRSYEGDADDAAAEFIDQALCG